MRRFLVLSLILCVLLSAGSGGAATVTKWLLGTSAALLTTQLNSLANNAYSTVGSTFNNTVGATGDGYLLCDVEGRFTFVSAPSTNSAVVVWFLMTADGTNFEDTPTATVSLGRAPDVVLPVTAGQTTTRVIRRVTCPWGQFRAVAKNDGTGQALTASGHTVTVRMATPQQF